MNANHATRLPRSAWTAPLLAAGLLLLPSHPVAAQTADPADVGSIDAIIAALYDVISGEAGEERNWDRWHSLFAEGATLTSVGRAGDGTVRRVIMTPQDWIDRSGAFVVENGFIEAEIGRVTEQYGLIAHTFSTYESYQSASDDEPFARGINSFQLLNDGSRWWFVSVFWQGESSAFPIPEKYIGNMGEVR